MEEMEEKELPEEEPMMEPSSTDFIFFIFRPLSSAGAFLWAKLGFMLFFNMHI